MSEEVKHAVRARMTPVQKSPMFKIGERVQADARGLLPYGTWVVIRSVSVTYGPLGVTHVYKVALVAFPYDRLFSVVEPELYLDAMTRLGRLV